MNNYEYERLACIMLFSWLLTILISAGLYHKK